MMSWRQARTIALVFTVVGFTTSARGEEQIIHPFNGKSLDGWAFQGPKEKSHWMVGSAALDKADPTRLSVKKADGNTPAELVNAEAHGVDLYTEQKFGSCVIELEFMIPKESNSGIYVMGEYEVQVLDSYGKEKLGPGDLGGIYATAAPAGKNFAKMPGFWQTVRIDFQAPKFDGDKKVADAVFRKVMVNGITIHENVTITKPTPGGLTGKEAATGPLMFQGNHGAVSFRDIRIRPADSK